MPVTRRSAPPAQEGASFGDLGFYGGSLGLPEGLYAVEFFTQLFQPTKRDGTAAATPPFLAVMMAPTPINEKGEAVGEPLDPHPLGMGGKAKDGWVPTPNGKGIVAIPGTSVSLPDSTNWAFFLKSLYDCGLPQGTFTNDLSVLDGVWIRTQNVPEPESRKQFRSATSEAAMEGQPEVRNRKMTVVTEILEDGKPWEGTGGMPAAAKKGAAKPAAAAAKKPASKPAPEPEPEGDEDLETLVQSAIADVVAAKPNGVTRVMMRTSVFAAIKKSHDDETANSAMDYFSDDETLNTILEPLGYVSDGKNIKVA